MFALPRPAQDRFRLVLRRRLERGRHHLAEQPVLGVLGRAFFGCGPLFADHFEVHVALRESVLVDEVVFLCLRAAAEHTFLPIGDTSRRRVFLTGILGRNPNALRALEGAVLLLCPALAVVLEDGHMLLG